MKFFMNPRFDFKPYFTMDFDSELDQVTITPKNGMVTADMTDEQLLEVRVVPGEEAGFHTLIFKGANLCFRLNLSKMQAEELDIALSGLS